MRMESDRSRNLELAARFKRWLLVQKYSINTRLLYCRAVAGFTAFIGNRSILTTNHFDIQEYLSKLASKDISSLSLRNYLYSLRIYFDFLSLGGLLKWSPPRIVQTRVVGRYVPKVLTVEDVRKVFGAARTTHERALLEVLYGTGCRTSEARTMRIEDIDFKRRRIRVIGKSGFRVVMFPRHVAGPIRRYIAGRTSGFLFVEARKLQSLCPAPVASGAWRCRWRKYDSTGHFVGWGNGFIRASEHYNYQQALAEFSKQAAHDRIHRPIGSRPLSSTALQSLVRKVATRVGVKAHPYAFRHTFATHLLDNGADIRVIQELMGHRSIRSTQAYTHVSKSKLVRNTLDKCHPRIAWGG